MSVNAQPYEARQLPALPPEVDACMAELVTAVNGFPYQGPGTDALYYGIRWLRANPRHAAVLLGVPAGQLAPVAPRTGDEPPLTRQDLVTEVVARTVWHSFGPAKDYPSSSRHMELCEDLRDITAAVLTAVRDQLGVTDLTERAAAGTSGGGEQVPS